MDDFTPFVYVVYAISVRNLGFERFRMEHVANVNAIGLYSRRYLHRASQYSSSSIITVG